LGIGQHPFLTNFEADFKKFEIYFYPKVIRLKPLVYPFFPPHLPLSDFTISILSALLSPIDLIDLTGVGWQVRRQ